jgi:hypothetical protein
MNPTEDLGLGALRKFIRNEDFQRDISLQLFVFGEPDCRVTAKTELMHNFVAATAEGVTDNSGMIATD